MILRDSIDDLFLQALAVKSDAVQEAVLINDGVHAMDALEASGVQLNRADAFVEDVRAMSSWWDAKSS